MTLAIKLEHVSKQYRLGVIGTGTIAHDLNRWWALLRGKEDPYSKIGQVNEREESASGEYVWALQDVNLEVERGTVLGIIGRNGAGKSTLLKLLSRVTSPTTGVIKARGRIASLLEVGTGFHPELTGRENIYMNGAVLGMRRFEIAEQLDAIVEFSGCQKYLDTPVKRYSSGMTVRLGFAVAAHLNCETLIVDEVLAVGDLEFQAKCIGKMKEVSQSGRTVLFVSHNMASIKKLCDRGVLVERGRVSAATDIEETINAYTSKFRLSDASIDLDASTAETEIGFATRIEIFDEHGELTSSVPACRPWGFRIRIEIVRELQHFILGWGLVTETDAPCRNSWMKPTRLAPGRYVIEVRDTEVKMSHGRYVLKIGLSEHERTFHHIDAANVEFTPGFEPVTRFNIPGVPINESQFTISPDGENDRA